MIFRYAHFWYVRALHAKLAFLLITLFRAAAAKSAPGGRRPVSGAFSLDLEKMEHSLEDKLGLQMPKLVKLDIDEIINEPVRFPETKYAIFLAPFLIVKNFTLVLQPFSPDWCLSLKDEASFPSYQDLEHFTGCSICYGFSDIPSGK